MSPAIPSSWYYVCETSEVAVGEIRRVEAFGRTLALWRTQSGAVHATDATCPHLGTDLTKRGRVVGEELECFTHKFRYDGAGDCVATGTGEMPCRSQGVLRKYPVQETAGFVLVWYDAHGREPTWTIPEAPLGYEGRGRPWKSQYVFETCAQTINEDNFDIGHLYSWHELHEVASAPVEVYGPRLRIVHDFRRHSLVLKKPLPPPFDVLSQEIVSRYSADLYGHGLTLSQIDLPTVDFHVEDVIWVTPIDDKRIRYTTFLRQIRPQGARTLRQRMLDRVLHPLLVPIFVARLRQEHRHEGYGFWQNQTHIADPILRESENEYVGVYREWCKQFEPGPAPEQLTVLRRPA
ncbi:MAG: Rieske 2Fe-2S domain-containing protein [Myxococcota bacterium]